MVDVGLVEFLKCRVIDRHNIALAVFHFQMLSHILRSLKVPRIADQSHFAILKLEEDFQFFSR